MKNSENVERYLRSCQDDFWKAVFEAEIGYLLQNLAGCLDILSVGCGPAAIESALGEHGFRVTGLDVSREALGRAPDNVRTVVSRAEDMPFPQFSFDAVIYVASLQFIEDYKRALKKSAHVLRPDGRLIAMLLNPASSFFEKKVRDPHSYVHGIRHPVLEDIENVIAEDFNIRTEYFLGIREDDIFGSTDPAEAALYVVKGKLKPPEARRLFY